MKQKRVVHEVIERIKDFFDPKKITLREIIRRTLLLVCVVAFLWSGKYVVSKWYQDYVAEQIYKGLQIDMENGRDETGIFQNDTENASDFEFELQPPDGIKSAYTAYTQEYKQGDFLTSSGRVVGAKYFGNIEINQDVIGYIYIPDTEINYAVLHHRVDNEYYLHRNIEKKNYFPGSIYMDNRNRPYSEDRNTILYGHNMNNGSMFANLHKYRKDRDFALSHQEIYYSTIYEDMVWQVFSSYKVDLVKDEKAGFDYIQTNFGSDEEFKQYIDTCKSRSQIKYDITPEVGDRILTLSTCIGDDPERFAVQAVLVSRTKR